MELRIPAAQSGIHALRLPYALQSDVDYQWTIAAVINPDQRASDILASGAIRRVDPSPALTARLGQASPSEQVFIYAEQGFWYDALAVLSEQIEKRPHDHVLRRQRAGLLEQVGLSAIAAVNDARSQTLAAHPTD